MSDFSAVIEILPGLKLIPESPTYSVRDESCSGKFSYFCDQGYIAEVKFHLVNSLLKPADMSIFNLATFNQLVQERIRDAMLGEKRRVFSVHWDESTGLALPT